MSWWGHNWGNVASLIGMILAVPSLLISIIAWKQAKSARQFVRQWQHRHRLENIREALIRAQRTARQLRGARKNKKWPVSLRVELREDLLRAHTDFEWPESVSERFEPVIAELRHDISVSAGSSAYLEAIVDLAIQCEATINQCIHEVLP
jgi:hypothetical protein